MWGHDGTGRLKPFPQSYLLLTQAAAKWKKGFLETARGALGKGHHSLTHKAPEISTDFVKGQGPGAWKWQRVTGPSPAGPEFPPHLPAWSPPAYLSGLVMEIRGGTSSGSVVGLGGSGTPGSEGSVSAQPRPGPVERRRRGRRRSAPSMLALVGSGVSQGL